MRDCVDMTDRMLEDVMTNGDTWDDYYKGKDKGCDDATLWGYKTVDCICNEDGCNGSGMVTFSVGVVLVAVAGRFLF